MEKSSRYTLDMGLRSKGYHLEFKVKSSINGGFECYIFSDGKRVVIIIGKRVHIMGRGDKTRMFYKYHYCQLGDKGYLEKFLESEILLRNPELLTGDYGEMFRRLIDKIRSFGKMVLDSKAYGGTVNNRPTNENVYFLSTYKKIRSSTQCRDQRFCRMT